jgi:hypothetical protein
MKTINNHKAKLPVGTLLALVLIVGLGYAALAQTGGTVTVAFKTVGGEPLSGPLTIEAKETVGEHNFDHWEVSGITDDANPLSITTDGDKVIKAVFVKTVVEVSIDIKPGTNPNHVNLGSHGVLPVAILSSDSFDATQVNPETVKLAGAEVAVRGKGNKYLAHEEDVNGDGLLDLVLQVETENLDPPDTFQDGFVTLTGSTLGGEEFEGKDEIVIVPL